ncbi:MAG: hypothetical protein J3K34DRAFT_519919 [Monoraphidium minutum]|nr:MAG: hypothetical protein J3K34DRAFT_519919 [Monoraphidium minutum]
MPPRRKSAVAGHDLQRLPRFLEWMKQNGIWWNEDLMSIDAGVDGCSGVAVGCLARVPVPEGALLCRIPKAAVLSPRTTAIAAILEEERVGHGLALTVAAMYEASIGARSKWHGYLASLPAREYLPLFWEHAELALLEGTELEGAVEEDRADTEHDYETVVAPLMARHPAAFPPGSCGLGSFRAAASWVASRAFYIDALHGEGMVPLADAFNHKASVVALAEGYEVGEVLDRTRGARGGGDSESGGGSEEEEGEEEEGEEGEEEGEEDEEEEEEAEGEEEEEGGAGGQGFVGVGGAAHAHRPVILSSSGAAEWERDGLNLRLEIGICSVDDDEAAGGGDEVNGGGDEAAGGDDEAAGGDEAAGDGEAASGAGRRRRVGGGGRPGKRRREGEAERAGGGAAAATGRLEIVAASDVAAGCEIHNTYGEHSNAELLRKYGFALPANPFDSVTLDAAALLAAAAAELGDEVARGAAAPGAPPAFAAREAAVAAARGGRELRRRVRWLQAHSDLLSDDCQGDIAALPHGRVTPELFCLLRALCVPGGEFEGWGCLADALRGHRNEGGGGACGGGGAACGARTVGGVPLESLLSGGGGRESGEEEGGGSGDGGPKQADAVEIGGEAAALWSPPMARVLSAALRARCARYPEGSSLEGDQRALARLGAADRSERAAAARGALQLRAAERALLRRAEQAAAALL